MVFERSRLSLSILGECQLIREASRLQSRKKDLQWLLLRAEAVVRETLDIASAEIKSAISDINLEENTAIVSILHMPYFTEYFSMRETPFPADTCARHPDSKTLRKDRQRKGTSLKKRLQMKQMALNRRTVNSGAINHLELSMRDLRLGERALKNIDLIWSTIRMRPFFKPDRQNSIFN